jgi:TonB family protein
MGQLQAEHLLHLSMTGTLASIGVSTLAACLAIEGALMSSVVYAQNAGSGEPVDMVRFDISPESLVVALHAYSRATGVAVMARTQWLDGLSSAPVNGDYSAREGLQRLLIGTGLQARFTGPDEAAVVPLTTSDTTAAPAPASSATFAFIDASQIDGALEGAAYNAYNAMVQTQLAGLLCASARTRPGDYRLVVQMRMGNTGTVLASKIVGSTGDALRDEAIEQAVKTLSVNASPPAGLPQPVTILLRPRGPGVNTDCARFDVQN